ncbi:MAG: hypothetical protein DRN12_04115 [Thermoplasmata archaeon]|nr:MAG: hypothetical protein DRN12_04115 [Thermoplasmata archaeon]
MSIIEGLLILLFLVTIYGVLALIFERRGLFKKYGISFYGPALLLRTKKGVNLLKRIARREKLWKHIGTAGIILCITMMILVLMLLFENTWTVMNWTPEQQKNLPGIEFGLVIPGLNPILPLNYLLYIVIALIIAVVAHEFSHGILTCAHRLKLKSLGLLYLIIPLGAFAEPDEDQLRETEPIKRMRIYAAGPTANFIIAFITILLFSFVFISAVQPIEGVHILYVVDNSPADEINLKTASVVTSLNNTPVKNVSDFIKVMENVRVNQTIPITYYQNGRPYNSNITAASKYLFTKNVSDINKSFLGVGFNIYVNGFINVLKHPFTSNGFLLLYSLPFLGYFMGYNPIVYPYTQSYIITGPLSVLPVGLFWGIVNTLYWIFWLDLVVALFNVLPMIPLDGGFLFTDIIRVTIQKIGGNLSEERREKIVKNISLTISIFILFIVLYPWLIKYL